MFKVMMALHLLTAIFAIGPLVHASTTASRGLRQKDAAALTASARMVKIYSIVSVVVVIFGFGLMSADAPWGKDGEKVASFGEPWIWISVILWLVAVGLCHALIIPPLEKAAANVEQAPSFTAKVAAGGGVVGLIFAVIVVLMVYRPGA